MRRCGKRAAPNKPKGAMRVLLLGRDLYGGIGGGETAYRKLIADNPDISFVYFREREPADAIRPENASCVRLAGKPGIEAELSSAAELENLRIANAYARSVAGQDFDI